MAEKETIGVFFGGKSPEHDVSIITGELILSGLKKLGYPVVPVYIGQDGAWYAAERLGELKFFSGQDFKEKLEGLDELSLDMEASHGKMVLKEKKLLGAKTYAIDIAFPGLHGRNGEDGTIQGLFEMLDMPYVGCDVASSALAMDKVSTKLLYRAEGIPTTAFTFFSRHDWETDQEDVLKKVGKLAWPLFVKPARLGSSIGIAKARDKKELEFAIEVALHYDTKVIVEEGVEPVMDVTCAVIGHSAGLQASLLQESSFGKDFFSYEDKYLNDGGAQLGNAAKSIVIPASLDAETTAAIRTAALEIFRLFGCSGTTRVDFLYNKETKKWYANELNTLPGTLYHHLWKESGVELPELLERLLAYAKEKHSETASMTHTFKSEILNLARSAKLRLKGN